MTVDKVKSRRLEKLNNAKKLAFLEAKYSSAIRITNELIKNNKNDQDALRLKGNILDLRGAVKLENVDSEKQIQEFEQAKKCYEHVLRINKKNILAYIDLGDYWNHRKNFKEALTCYDKAISFLKKGCYYMSLEDEIEETYYSKFYLLNDIGKKDEASKCISEMRSLLEEKGDGDGKR